MPTHQKKYMSPKELCERWEGHIHPRTLANWRSDGFGPPYHKFGGLVLYAIAEVEEWEAERKVSSTWEARKLKA